MLSYQHHYHVGNHADVLKHWVLFECVKHFLKKDKPFEYIDTHAGAGLYSLLDEKTLKLKEFEDGINRLMTNTPEALAEFVAFIRNFIEQQQYPGSPAIVDRMLRRGDKSWLFELHPQTFAEITQHCARRRKTFVRQESGFQGLNGLLPVASKRALVLIDPSYELKEDYQNVCTAIERAYRKMPQATLLLWYPVVKRSNVSVIEDQLLASPVRNIVQLELNINPDSDETGMTGSGMILVNPPWTLALQAEKVLPTLLQTLAMSKQGFIRQILLKQE